LVGEEFGCSAATPTLLKLNAASCEIHRHNLPALKGFISDIFVASLRSGNLKAIPMDGVHPF
jgi:hypothetical protein